MFAVICTITEVSPSSESKSGPYPDLVLAHLQLDPHADGLVDREVFESITNPGKLLILGSWREKISCECLEADLIRRREPLETTIAEIVD